jgi:phenylalanyl-tRNA synthetase alpha chain
MMNEEIPNLTAFDEAALDEAFALVERQARGDATALNGDAAVEAFRLKWLGSKQGRLKEVSGRWLKAAPSEAKKGARPAVQRAQGGGRGAVGRGPGLRAD